MGRIMATIESRPENRGCHVAKEKHGVGSSSGSEFGSNHLIVWPENGGVRDLVRYVAWGDEESGAKFLDGPDHRLVGAEAADNRWVIAVSILVRKIMGHFRKPMEYIGFLVDLFLNLLYGNDGVFGLLLRLVHGNVVIPRRGSETFISTIGQLDRRVNLYRGQNLVEQLLNSVSGNRNVEIEMGNRALMDLCMMASKLAYENAKVVENVIHLHWKMHFVEFLDCWNDYQKQLSTQVIILTDKPKDANLILIGFRGTEPFDADDWSTDFDYSWYEIPNLGKLHMGFLEALGLGSRTNALTFQSHLWNQTTKFKPSESGKLVPPEMAERTAYYSVKRKLKHLLAEHKNAKFLVTGHSLGGALAILFPTVLVLHEETEMIKRLLGVYTFGQPRIGDRCIGKFMEAHLVYPVPKYFRVVYCNDLVPRLPYDDKTFLYKHFGVCLYYDSFYNEKKMEEEPDPNMYGLRYMIPRHLNAVWELIRGLTMGYTHGPEYKEGWFRILFRVMGLVVPGVSAHCPTDYVNSMRLGQDSTLQMSSF